MQGPLRQEPGRAHPDCRLCPAVPEARQAAPSHTEKLLPAPQLSAPSTAALSHLLGFRHLQDEGPGMARHLVSPRFPSKAESGTDSRGAAVWRLPGPNTPGLGSTHRCYSSFAPPPAIPAILAPHKGPQDPRTMQIYEILFIFPNTPNRHNLRACVPLICSGSGLECPQKSMVGKASSPRCCSWEVVRRWPLKSTGTPPVPVSGPKVWLCTAWCFCPGHSQQDQWFTDHTSSPACWTSPAFPS